jgi:transcriptional regulator with XRE-family HTH domain
MQTRIREFRKLRGLTLKELADKIKTTPQTVQRLETANMTVSMDWLEKIARALLVEPADLLGPRSNHDVKLIGRISEQGLVIASSQDKDPVVHLQVPSDNCVAVRLDLTHGDYVAGTILIANKLRQEDITNAYGRDCIVKVKNGQTMLCRVIRGRGETLTLIQLQNGGVIQYDQEIDWVAVIVMSIKYY